MKKTRSTGGNAQDPAGTSALALRPWVQLPGYQGYHQPRMLRATGAVPLTWFIPANTESQPLKVAGQKLYRRPFYRGWLVWAIAGKGRPV